MISVSSPSLSLLEVEDVVERVAASFEAWEIVAEGHHHLSTIEARLAETLPSYDLEITVHAPMSDINIGSLSPRMREAAVNEILDTIAVMGRLGFGIITVHPGFMTPIGRHAPNAVMESMRRSLSEIASEAEENDVRVALENMPDFLIATCKDPSPLVDMMDGAGIGMCFDVGHANTNGNIEEFMAIRDRFINVHVHDNDGSHDQHLPVGEGNIDFRSFLSAMNGYRGKLVIESRNLDEALTSLPRLKSLLDQ